MSAIPKPAHYRYNFTMGILNGLFVNIGLAFIDPFTVIPAFITVLGGSSFLVGLASSTYGAGWFLPQIFVSRWVQAREKVLPIYTAMSVLRFFAWGALAYFIFTIDPLRTQLLAYAVIACLFVNTLCAGIAGVPFLEVTSKTIPPQRRGLFFGMRRLTGGILGVVAGILVSVIVGNGADTLWSRGWSYRTVQRFADWVGLTGHPFPNDYGFLVCIGGAFITIGLMAYSMTREPSGETESKSRSMHHHFARGIKVIRENRNYRLFFWVRVAWSLTAMAFPFYGTYAYRELGFSEATVGVFVSIWVGAGVLSNYLWGRIADAYGNRVVLVASAAIALASPLLVLLTPQLGSPRLAGIAIAVCFFINGTARNGRFISNMTYLLEFAPDDQRPLYVGFLNSLSFPLMLFPALAGAMVDWVGYPAMFASAFVFGVVNLVLSRRLDEPRHPVETAAMPSV